ncbi:LysR substrate-binding domain-containing protein [Rhodovulum sulfidophilum]|uniref:LysR substrate-binding domain-containing protein n=1 Tax=Rhodovulum sulfidophilum TaxID=35806 RepID=UPI001F1B76B9|nr:LysR substrate-binding domain-containing protein [Rhodovulum sulfidophilum]
MSQAEAEPQARREARSSRHPRPGIRRQHDPFYNCSQRRLADIADEDFVLWPIVEGRGFHLQVIRLCTDAGFVPRVTQEAHGMHAVLSLVAVGAGVSVVPESMRQFRPDQITYQPIAEAGADFPLCLALHQPGPATVAFKEIASYGGFE